ncbi:hypothetical protein [Micromonospora lupini]|uniref:hypothetical protein n=1 Tax=Micromonospora lupini TaxID=285679 RepID=UPI0031E3F1CD
MPAAADGQVLAKAQSQSGQESRPLLPAISPSPSGQPGQPHSVTAGIAERVGGTFDVTSASGGNHAEIASTVTGPAGRIFVKAASGELSVRSLRYELATTRAIDRHPPAVLWQFESDGWLVVGTEHLAGPHPDL